MDFIDTDFLPNNKAIALSEQQIIEKYNCLIDWRRVG